MALQKVIQVRSDDLGGTGKATPLTFAVNGEEYVIDLNKRNTETLLRQLSKYTEVARPAKQDHRKTKNPESRAIRAWAIENGYDVPSRGRIPVTIQNAFYNEKK